MKIADKTYISLILFHALIGALVFAFLPLAKVYAFLMIGLGLILVIKNQNRNNEVLYVAAYIVGSEVFLRMTGGNPNHEFSKYGVILFMILGMYYSGMSKNAIPYWVFILLLIPGIVVGTQVLGGAVEMRKTIIFNISGEICLAISAIYCYLRPITLTELKSVLLAAGLPIISCAIYLTLYTPDLREVVTSTGSNFATSGGFGPNQVATALGLGIFIFAGRMIFDSPSFRLVLVNFLITTLFTYRGLLTFSRGGMIAGLLMILALIVITFFKVNNKGKRKVMVLISFFLLIFVLSWTYTSVNTGGLIDKRYQNKDAMGREKESKFSGREAISLSEIEGFLENPLLGMGVAKGTEIRKQKTGVVIASHNEITRLVGEHGFFGILALLLLLTVPLIALLGNKGNIYIIPFLLFWFLTLNHAAMRTAAPAFIYALSLLKVVLYENTDIRRE
jgi:hypothetical protein